ncbi:MAG: 2-amino-4-hydroxy-6-hydroxymethyldihydropteridine diphosphokinase [Haliea sp.]|nr:2-amino-4-hydroxy-6-hydroxymethyldihydropteridine diphosphokinase [Haliea sp.]MDP5064717.1 2-amino-4-hydroxy-6-hydroxymethyldihydropteridine diphosphokinase [Haliea sp.]
MTEVFLGLGSNLERERYLVAGLDSLQALFGSMKLSSVYDSAAIGFDGHPFLNMVVAVDTSLSLAAMATRLRQIETEHGRPMNATRFSPRTLDIDILTFGDLVGEHDSVVLPRGEILENAFVLRPLAELAPRARHPVNGASYAELWRAFSERSQVLVRVDFCWRGRCFSRRIQ